MKTFIYPRAERLKELIVLGPILIASPVFLITFYLWCADHWFRWNNLTDSLASVLTLLVGVVGVALLPISRVARGIAALVYVALAVWIMILLAIVWRGGL